MIKDYLHEIDPYAGLDLGDHEYNALAFNVPKSVLDHVRALKPRLIFEVGSWRGGSAIHMASILKEEGLDTEIVCIDTWLGALEMWTKPLRDLDDRYSGLKLRNGYPTIYSDFLRNVVIAGHQDRITPFPTTSAIGARALSSIEAQAEFIYIDGSHDYDDVKADIIAYWELLAPGGMMGGDDHNDYWSGVTTAVHEFSESRGVELKVFPMDDGWMLYKPQAAAQ